MTRLCRDLAASEVFQSFILLVIVINGAAMGLETYPAINDHYENEFFLLLWISQIIFVLEIAIRLFAHAPSFNHFFRSFWNSFDFGVVAASLIPAIGPFATIARLARLMRLTRIFSVSDELRETIHSGRSVQRILAILFVFAVCLYIFAVTGTYLFSEIDPARWDTLSESFTTIGNVLSFQTFPQITERGLWSILYWLSFAAVVLTLILALVRPQKILPLLAKLEADDD